MSTVSNIKTARNGARYVTHIVKGKGRVQTFIPNDVQTTAQASQWLMSNGVAVKPATHTKRKPATRTTKRTERPAPTFNRELFEFEFNEALEELDALRDELDARALDALNNAEYARSLATLETLWSLLYEHRDGMDWRDASDLAAEKIDEMR